MLLIWESFTVLQSNVICVIAFDLHNSGMPLYDPHLTEMKAGKNLLTSKLKIGSVNNTEIQRQGWKIYYRNMYSATEEENYKSTFMQY
jgi:hypothetical protein